MDATIQNGIALNPKSILTKVDITPTADSNNLVSSDGVKTYVDQKDQATNIRVDALNTQIAASFFFKGSSTFAELPASGNTINDTYYVTDSDKECWYSWNGTDWIKSSMSQADYAGLIAQLKADISAEYSTSKTYKVGDYCLYGADGVLYICKAAVTTAGAFDSDKWQAISFGEAVGDLVIADDTQPTSLANKIWLDTDPNPDTVEVITEEDLGNIVAGEFDSSSAYAVGDYCTHDAKLYVANTATAVNDGWIAARWQQVTVMGTINDQVGNLETQIDKLIELPTENLVDITDFTVITAKSTISTDPENDTITVTTTSAGAYQNAQTADTFISQNLVAGRSYRLHAKAEFLSGTPTVRVAIRGMADNPDQIACAIALENGESGFIDFIADEYMKRVSLFVTMADSASASVEFSELWLKEYDTSGKDIEAQEEINSIKKEINSIEIYESIQGNPIVFENGTEYTDFKDVQVDFSPMQSGSGDPSTTNIRPISSRASLRLSASGDNMLEMASYSGITYNVSVGAKVTPIKTSKVFVDNGDGSFSLSMGHYSQNAFVFDLIPGVTFHFAATFRTSGTDVGRTYGYLSEDNTVLTKSASHGSSVTVDTDFIGTNERRRGYVEFTSRAPNATNVITIALPRLTFGSGKKPYNPYTGSQLAISFPDEAGTVYGGTVDLENGLLISKYALVSLNGTEEWEFTGPEESPYFQLSLGEAGTIEDGSEICSHFVSADIINLETEIGCQVLNSVESNAALLCIRPADSAEMDVDDFKAWLSEQASAGTPVQIAYKVSEPQEFMINAQTIPAVEGRNIVFTTGDFVSMEYVRRTKEYIDVIKTQITQIGNNCLLSQQFQLPRSFWIRKSGIDNSGASTDSDDLASTVGCMCINGFIRVVSNDKNIFFSVFDIQNNKWINSTETENGWMLESETPYYYKLVARCVDGTEMTGEKLDNIYIYTNPVTAVEYESRYYYKIENSYRFPAYNASNSICVRYGMDTSEGNIGTLLRRHQTSRVTWKECVCETSDCVLWCGQFSQSSMVIVIDNEVAATITRGMSFTVPKGKRFICNFLTSSNDESNNIETTCFHIVPNSTPSWGSYQLLSNTGLAGQDTSFTIGDKIYCIGRENTGYSVKQGDTWLVSNQSLGINVGHANSCNYDSKTQKVYVSDWTDPGKIYAFVVNDDDNTLTYDRTIDMPTYTRQVIIDGVPTQVSQGSTEYYVFDNEKQVFYLGWDIGNSGTDPNTMIMGLFVSTTNGYVKSWEKKVVRAVCIQSMVVQNNYMYYVEVNPSDSYHTLGVSRINISTGVTEYNSVSAAGTIATVEAEGISAIGEGAFIIMARNGYTFLALFKKADAIYD